MIAAESVAWSNVVFVKILVVDIVAFSKVELQRFGNFGVGVIAGLIFSDSMDKLARRIDSPEKHVIDGIS